MPNLSLFRWRLTFAVLSAAVWAAWYWIANHGQPFQIFPTDEDFIILRRTSLWIGWARFYLMPITAVPFVLIKKLRNLEGFGSWGVFWMFQDLLSCVFLGWLLMPWGLTFTLAVIILPVLELMRPYRSWGLSFETALVDFAAIRMIYVFAVLVFHADALVGDSDAASTLSEWLAPIFAVMYAILALVGTWLYWGFLIRSIKLYDPFIDSWRGNLAYSVGAFVMHNNITYRCIQTGTGFQPDTCPTHWLPVDPREPQE